MRMRLGIVFGGACGDIFGCSFGDVPGNALFVGRVVRNVFGGVRLRRLSSHVFGDVFGNAFVISHFCILVRGLYQAVGSSLFGMQGNGVPCQKFDLLVEHVTSCITLQN